MGMQDRTPGWYGKLPTLGDFASRRLEPSFIEPWDTWLATGLAGLRERASDTWLEHYLSSPVWRFVLMPGVILPDTAMAGVLMPSVDRVGRYFPLTIAAPMPSLPTSSHGLDALQTWLYQLDDVAADALHEDWDIEHLDQVLARFPLPDWGDAPPMGSQALRDVMQGTQPSQMLGVDSRQALQDLLAYSAATQWQKQAQGLAFWWADALDGPPRNLVSHGLPADTGFAALMGPAAP